MKRFALAATIAGSLIAMPAVAEETKPVVDPFVSTQGELGVLGAGAAVLAGVTFIILIASSDGT